MRESANHVDGLSDLVTLPKLGRDYYHDRKTKTPFADGPIRPLLRHVAVIGAAGGLGQGILDVCRTEGIGFTAILRSRPERITHVPRGSHIVVVPSFTDYRLLREAFFGADAVLTALGVATASHDRSALLSANRATVEEAILASQVASSRSIRFSRQNPEDLRAEP